MDGTVLGLHAIHSISTKLLLTEGPPPRLHVQVARTIRTRDGDSDGRTRQLQRTAGKMTAIIKEQRETSAAPATGIFDSPVANYNRSIYILKI